MNVQNDAEIIILAADEGQTEALKYYMRSQHIPFKEVVGAYTMGSGEWIEEPSFIIEKKYFYRVLSSGLCRYQESFLFLGSLDYKHRRRATLVYRHDSSEEYIGLFQGVSEDVAKRQVGYTFDNGQYYTAL